jgi:hypothetical protein
MLDEWEKPLCVKSRGIPIKLSVIKVFGSYNKRLSTKACFLRQWCMKNHMFLVTNLDDLT